MDNNIELENKPKNIIERHQIENRFNMATAFLELEAKYITATKRIDAIEEAMSFFVNWYEEMNSKQKIELLDKPKIQLL